MDLLLFFMVFLVMGAMNIACFIVGAKVGQTVQKGEPIRLPSVDPMKAIRERQEERADREKQERVDAILRNVENYDGTEHGQEDVPGGR